MAGLHDMTPTVPSASVTSAVVGAHPGSGRSRLAAGMAAADNNDIVSQRHRIPRGGAETCPSGGSQVKPIVFHVKLFESANRACFT